jgi:hypothetical protein
LANYPRELSFAGQIVNSTRKSVAQTTDPQDVTDGLESPLTLSGIRTATRRSRVQIAGVVNQLAEHFHEENVKQSDGDRLRPAVWSCFEDLQINVGRFSPSGAVRIKWDASSGLQVEAQI